MYDALFRKLGAAEVVVGPAGDPRARRTTPTWSTRSTRSTGIFMTGGNQLKLSAVDLRHAVRRGAD